MQKEKQTLAIWKTEVIASFSRGVLHESGCWFISEMWVVPEGSFVENFKSWDTASFICLTRRFQKQSSWAVLRKGVQEICSKFTGERLFPVAISIKLQNATVHENHKLCLQLGEI